MPRRQTRSTSNAASSRTPADATDVQPMHIDSTGSRRRRRSNSSDASQDERDSQDKKMLTILDMLKTVKVEGQSHMTAEQQFGQHFDTDRDEAYADINPEDWVRRTDRLAFSDIEKKLDRDDNENYDKNYSRAKFKEDIEKICRNARKMAQALDLPELTALARNVLKRSTELNDGIQKVVKCKVGNCRNLHVISYSKVWATETQVECQGHFHLMRDVDAIDRNMSQYSYERKKWAVELNSFEKTLANVNLQSRAKRKIERKLRAMKNKVDRNEFVNKFEFANALSDLRNEVPKSTVNTEALEATEVFHARFFGKPKLMKCADCGKYRSVTFNPEHEARKAPFTCKAIQYHDRHYARTGIRDCEWESIESLYIKSVMEKHPEENWTDAEVARLINEESRNEDSPKMGVTFKDHSNGFRFDPFLFHLAIGPLLNKSRMNINKITGAYVHFANRTSKLFFPAWSLAGRAGNWTNSLFTRGYCGYHHEIPEYDWTKHTENEIHELLFLELDQGRIVNPFPTQTFTSAVKHIHSKVQEISEQLENNDPHAFRTAKTLPKALASVIDGQFGRTSGKEFYKEVYDLADPRSGASSATLTGCTHIGKSYMSNTVTNESRIPEDFHDTQSDRRYKDRVLFEKLRSDPVKGSGTKLRIGLMEMRSYLQNSDTEADNLRAGYDGQARVAVARTWLKELQSTDIKNLAEYGPGGPEQERFVALEKRNSHKLFHEIAFCEGALDRTGSVTRHSVHVLGGQNYGLAVSYESIKSFKTRTRKDFFDEDKTVRELALNDLIATSRFSEPSSTRRKVKRALEEAMATTTDDQLAAIDDLHGLRFIRDQNGKVIDIEENSLAKWVSSHCPALQALIRSTENQPSYLLLESETGSMLMDAFYIRRVAFEVQGQSFSPDKEAFGTNADDDILKMANELLTTNDDRRKWWGKRAPLIANVYFSVPSSILREIGPLIDTAGLNDKDPSKKLRTKKQIQKSNVIMFAFETSLEASSGLDEVAQWIKERNENVQTAQPFTLEDILFLRTEGSGQSRESYFWKNLQEGKVKQPTEDTLDAWAEQISDMFKDVPGFWAGDAAWKDDSDGYEEARIEAVKDRIAQFCPTALTTLLATDDHHAPDKFDSLLHFTGAPKLFNILQRAQQHTLLREYKNGKTWYEQLSKAQDQHANVKMKQRSEIREAMGDDNERQEALMNSLKKSSVALVKDAIDQVSARSRQSQRIKRRRQETPDDDSVKEDSVAAIWASLLSAVRDKIGKDGSIFRGAKKELKDAVKDFGATLKKWMGDVLGEQAVNPVPRKQWNDFASSSFNEGARAIHDALDLDLRVKVIGNQEKYDQLLKDLWSGDKDASTVRKALADGLGKWLTDMETVKITDEDAAKIYADLICKIEDVDFSRPALMDVPDGKYQLLREMFAEVKDVYSKLSEKVRKDLDRPPTGSVTQYITHLRMTHSSSKEEFKNTYLNRPQPLLHLPVSDETTMDWKELSLKLDACGLKLATDWESLDWNIYGLDQLLPKWMQSSGLSDQVIPEADQAETEKVISEQLKALLARMTADENGPLTERQALKLLARHYNRPVKVIEMKQDPQQARWTATVTTYPSALESTASDSSLYDALVSVAYPYDSGTRTYWQRLTHAHGSPGPEQPPFEVPTLGAQVASDSDDDDNDEPDKSGSFIPQHFPIQDHRRDNDQFFNVTEGGDPFPYRLLEQRKEHSPSFDYVAFAMSDKAVEGQHFTCPRGDNHLQQWQAGDDGGLVGEKVLVALDGVSGAPDSATMVDHLVQRIANRERDESENTGPHGARDLLRRSYKEVVDDMKNGEAFGGHKGACTAAVALLRGRTLHLTSVGDARYAVVQRIEGVFQVEILNDGKGKDVYQNRTRKVPYQLCQTNWKIRTYRDQTHTLDLAQNNIDRRFLTIVLCMSDGVGDDITRDHIVRACDDNYAQTMAISRPDPGLFLQKVAERLMRDGYNRRGEKWSGHSTAISDDCSISIGMLNLPYNEQAHHRRMRDRNLKNPIRRRDLNYKASDPMPAKPRYGQERSARTGDRLGFSTSHAWAFLSTIS